MSYRFASGLSPIVRLLEAEREYLPAETLEESAVGWELSTSEPSLEQRLGPASWSNDSLSRSGLGGELGIPYHFPSGHTYHDGGFGE